MSISAEIVVLNDGNKIPCLGLSTYQVEDSEKVAATLENALEVGYRYFDTAFFYKNEKLIGQIFKKWFSSGRIRREDLFIVSKLPQIGMWPYRVNEFIKLSLVDLCLDYVDLYLIQFPVGFQYTDTSELIPKKECGNVLLDEKIHLEAVWRAMEHEVRRGRTKSIGLCNFNKAQLERILKISRIPPAVIQVEANVYSQQKELKEYCDQNNIRLCAFSPLGSPESHLTNDPEIQRMSVKYKKSTAQIVLRFLIQLGTLVIQKSTSKERLKENMEIFDFALDFEDMELLRRLDRGPSGNYKRAYFERIYPGAEIHPEFPWK